MTKILLITLNMLTVILPAYSDEVDLSIRSIPEAQRVINSTLEMLSTADYGREGETPVDSYKRIVDELMQFGNFGRVEMLIQVALASLEEKQSNGLTMKLVQLQAVRGYALVEMTPDEIVNGFAPYYEQVTDTELKRWLEDALDMATIRESRMHPDFRSCVNYLESLKSNPPHNFAKYMYTKSPDTALSSIATIYLDKGEAKALVDQVKGEDEAQAVYRLSKRPEWWAKLYAAEKMKQNPKLRDPELIEQLKKSKNSVVSATIQEIEDEKK